MAGGARAARLGAVADHEARQPEQRRGGLAAIALQVVHPGHRILVEVEHPGIDQVDEGLPPEAVHPDRLLQGGRNRVGAHVAPRLALEGVAPPLQADLAGHRVRGRLAHPRDGQAEGVEREEMRAGGGRREQGRVVAVRVAGPHEILAMGLREGEPGLRRPAVGLRHQATAIRAAATLRFSATRML